MFGRILQRLHARAQELHKHPNLLVRRSVQLAMLVLTVIGLPPRLLGHPNERTDGRASELFGDPSFYAGIRDYLTAPGILRPWLGKVARRLAFTESIRSRRKNDHRLFILRLDGRIDQRILRNLLIWHNEILSSHPNLSDGAVVDVVLISTSCSSDEPRTSDLISVALMLNRVRNFYYFWDEGSFGATAPIFMSSVERLRRADDGGPGDDLRRPSSQYLERVEGRGTVGGVKLPLDGRKRAEDFCKMVFPGQVIFAVGVREDEDGFADPLDIEFWTCLFDKISARHLRVSFVILNRLLPSQRRVWPGHIRFAQCHGLSMQDMLSLVQVADGYVGVLDVFGLAANSAGRPGVYVALDDRTYDNGTTGSDNIATSSKIMLGDRNRVRLEAALGQLLSSTFGRYV
jgi:hypothetical protein